MEYEIVPLEAFRIIRNCPGCRQKMSYVSTGNFRINANKNQLDVWLIYQCPKCRHTYNLTIYERVRPDRIDAAEYQRFSSNDGNTALRYGLDRTVFAKNRAEIDWNAMAYEIRMIESRGQGEADDCSGEKHLRVQNPRGLKVRTERIAAELLQMSRSSVKQMIQDKTLEMKENAKESVIEIRIWNEQ